MRPLCCLIVAVSCGALISLPGCEPRGDRAILEWIDMFPPGLTGIWTPPAELAKLDSFDLESWKQQGRALPDAEETIIRLLKCHDKRLDRRKALHVLNFVGTSKSVPVLIECLRDEDSWLHDEAACALEHIGVANGNVFVSLVRCVDYDHGSTSTNAARALARLFGKGAIETLRQHQQRLDWEAKRIAELLEDVENGRAVLGNHSRAAPKRPGVGK
jgi:hypothetical protein